MKILELRKKINVIYLFWGMVWLLLALCGLYFDTAVAAHYYRFELVPLLKDAKQYWFIINSELVLASFLILISCVRFPVLDPFFRKIQKEQTSGTGPFAWVITWFKENKTALLISKTIGLIAWLMVISGIIILIFKFTR